MYRLKYGSDKGVIDEIVDAAAAFFESWNPKVGMLIPVPPTRPRALQPVLLLAEALGRRLRLPFRPEAVARVKIVPELKDVLEYGARVKLLQGVHTVDRSTTAGQSVLLSDDLFRSGATMNAITDLIYEEGKASEVYSLTITRTRSKS